MARALPLSPELREAFILRIDQALDGKDPLAFVRRVFDGYPHLVAKLPPNNYAPLDFYRSIVRFCEVSAWAEQPPLIVTLLKAFRDFTAQDELIDQILRDGPFRCHPPGQPPLCAKVSAELPVIGRDSARLAALGFVPDAPAEETSRVLLVKGDTRWCVPATLAYFRYLADVQHETYGVLYHDFGDSEFATQAASANTQVEALIARNLEEQARRIREDLRQRTASAARILLRPALEKPFDFPKFDSLQQRTRWTRQLAEDLADRALFRDGQNPQCWIAIFDNCKAALPEAQELVRRLVELAAGTGIEDADRVKKRQIRVVLIGDGGAMLPSPLHTAYVLEEDLSLNPFGLDELITYYTLLGQSLELDLSNGQILAFAQNTLSRSQEMQGPASPPYLDVASLVRAVLEQSAQLEMQADRKKGAA